MNDSKAKLKKVAKAVSNDSGFLFLRELDKYINIIQEDAYLSRIIDYMFDSHEQESINLMKSINRAKTDIDAHILKDELSGRIEERYPTYNWKQLLKAKADFQHIKHYESEELIPDIEIVVQNQESEYAHASASTINLKRISEFTKIIGWEEGFKEFNVAFFNILEEIEAKGGIFSRFFDYNPDSGILYFKGSEIKINGRKKVTNANHLLAYLFQNEPFEHHYYTEFEEDKALLESKHWSSYHKACVDIQSKVLAKTGIADFLDFNSGQKMYVRINPLYSSLTN